MLSDLIKKYDIPERFDFPIGGKYSWATINRKEIAIHISAEPSKSSDLDYDDRDFYGLFSLDAVTDTILSCPKVVLTAELRIKLNRKISDLEAWREAGIQAVLAFEEICLQHTGEILRSFTQLDCSASYIVHTNMYWEPIDGFNFFGKLDKCDNGIRYTSWIETR